MKVLFLLLFVIAALLFFLARFKAGRGGDGFPYMRKVPFLSVAE